MNRSKRWAVLEPTQTPDAYIIAWAAGFIEGDGHVGRNNTTAEVSATQKQRWPLERLQTYFGGALGVVRRQGVTKSDYWRWRISGERARTFARLVSPYLSPEKLTQVEKL